MATTGALGLLTGQTIEPQRTTLLPGLGSNADADPFADVFEQEVRATEGNDRNENVRADNSRSEARGAETRSRDDDNRREEEAVSEARERDNAREAERNEARTERADADSNDSSTDNDRTDNSGSEQARANDADDGTADNASDPAANPDGAAASDASANAGAGVVAEEAPELVADVSDELVEQIISLSQLGAETSTTTVASVATTSLNASGVTVSGVQANTGTTGTLSGTSASLSGPGLSLASAGALGAEAGGAQSGNGQASAGNGQGGFGQSSTQPGFAQQGFGNSALTNGIRLGGDAPVNANPLTAQAAAAPGVAAQSAVAAAVQTAVEGLSGLSGSGSGDAGLRPLGLGAGLLNPVTRAETPFNSYATTIQTPVAANPQFGAAVATKVAFLITQNIQSAELHLNPADLGPVDVRIQVSQDQASVTFNAQNASVREALESSLVRLRESLESQGVNLADVNVSDQSAQQGRDDADAEAERAAGGSLAADTAIDGEVDERADEPQRVELDGLVNTYA